MTRVRKALGEPLLHFLLIGGALFLLYGWRGGSASPTAGQATGPTSEIVVTRADVEQLESLFVRTWQRPPTAAERDALIEDFVRNQVYVREAIALGLDRNDAVLERRLRQKMEFILEDIGAVVEPSDADLRAFVEEHPERYTGDPEVAFRQVYVDASLRGAGAEAEAKRVLAALVAGADPDRLGDRTMLEPAVPRSPLRDVAVQFGPDFAAAVGALEPGVWSGPVRSGFGLHLVRVDERVAGALPPWESLRPVAERDWVLARQNELKDAAYAKLRQRYTVRIEAPAPSTGAAPSAEAVK